MENLNPYSTLNLLRYRIVDESVSVAILFTEISRSPGIVSVVFEVWLTEVGRYLGHAHYRGDGPLWAAGEFIESTISDSPSADGEHWHNLRECPAVLEPALRELCIDLSLRTAETGKILELALLDRIDGGFRLLEWKTLERSS